ncbi:MAG: hypothetical protein PHQ25_07310 [Acidobacteriota bacterium]|nr:hypothetical protein [Acidobacteriota bacterium]MDW3228725.1 hypothetical protein [Acidobacteriota bacterium]
MYERRSERVISRRIFLRRLVNHLLVAALMVILVLWIGVSGYHWLAGFSWIDSLLEASMILGGMGPINSLATDTAKLFASTYALFSGLAFIAMMGIILAPVAHRMLHKFHADERDL